MTTNVKWLALTGGMTTALILAVTASANAATSADPGTEPSVLAMNQKIDKREVTLDYAYLPANGYAVVYGDKDGKPVKEPLGTIELKAGDHRGVKVKLNAEPQKGSKLWVSLYSDKDGKPGFDRKGDASFWTGDLPKENQIIVQ